MACLNYSIIGEYPGDKCNRKVKSSSTRCNGILVPYNDEGRCLCHCGMPPCSNCTDERITCPKCEYDNT